ncbi:hypothetical protein [Bacillus paranthracis]|uniref:hypothetical protein n=1 Tax=Bacillus paranthracis TaxID=2026186 RepID=UPI00220F5BC4|nr:hypothetical protein [Bacillus paranthracis]UXR28876.1 hypothetical protein [Bacillus phage Nachito]
MAEEIQHSPCYEFVKEQYEINAIKTPADLERLYKNGWITKAEFDEIVLLPKRPDPLLEYMKSNTR